LFVDGPGEDISRRCGRLYDNAYEDNQDFLFFEHLNKIDEGSGKGITSFFVRKSVYIAFFGILNLPSDKPTTTRQDIEPSSQEATTSTQGVNKDAPAVAGSQNPTNSQDVNMDFQYEFVLERPEMYLSME
jgi:Protein of unknown function (DUF3723)